MSDVRLEARSDRNLRLSDPPTAESSALYIVVTCSNRKHWSVPANLHARSLRARGVHQRIREWVERLESVPANQVPAQDLYAGEHWRIASTLTNVARTQRRVELWVLSAGYGLIRSETPIKPYSATFSASQPDAVVRVAAGSSPRHHLQEWWEGLAEWKPSGTDSRSLADLAAQDKQAAFLIVASPPYLQASAADLSRAFERVQNKSSFMILSVGGSTERIRVPNLLPAEARLQGAVGGTLGALNGRLAHFILKTFPVSELQFGKVKALFASLLAGLPARQGHGRAISSNDEVKAFIKRRIRPAVSASKLLREFRDAGRACEQSRFRGLYLEVEEEIGAK